jgi:hypothetical protein
MYGNPAWIRLLVIVPATTIVFIVASPKVRAPGPAENAIADLKTIYAAQLSYQSTFGNFAGNLVQLAGPVSFHRSWQQEIPAIILSF